MDLHNFIWTALYFGSVVFNQKFVSGSHKIKSTIEGLAFDRPCWAIMPDLLHTLHLSHINIIY